MDSGSIESDIQGLERGDVEELEIRVAARLGGRVRDFRLVKRGEGLVLEGRCQTRYAKQLAQQTVMEMTTLPILANEIEV